MNTVLLTIILWLPGTPEPQSWQVVSIPFTEEQCRKVAHEWESATFSLLEEYLPPGTELEDVAVTYCSSDGKLRGGKFKEQTNML